MNIVNRFKKQMMSKSTSITQAESQIKALLDFLGIDRDNEDMLSEATYFACLKVLSESIGKLTLKLLKYNEKQGVSNARKHPLYNVLHDRPNPYMTATSFWSTVEYNRNHYGNAYVLINTDKKSNTTLWILPSNEVEVWYDNAKLFKDIPDIYYIHTSTAGRFVYGSEEILHFKSSNTLDGYVGISVADQLKMTIKGSQKAQKLINKMYDSGFTAKAVLQYTGSLSDENTKTFLQGIEDYATGKLKDSGVENIIPIPVGSSLQPLNVKLADNQFIEVKQYTALQIASAFGIKPTQIGDYTKSSYASAEAQNLAFYVDTLLYIIKQYEDELTYKLLGEDEVKQGYHFKFNVAVILRADLKTQIDSLSTAVNSFIYTPNEARALMDLESKEGGDALLGNGSAIPVQLAGRQYTNSSNDNPDDSSNDSEDETDEESEETPVNEESNEDSNDNDSNEEKKGGVN